jgi:hypothetical protein
VYLNILGFHFTDSNNLEICSTGCNLRIYANEKDRDFFWLFWLGSPPEKVPEIGNYPLLGEVLKKNVPG